MARPRLLERLARTAEARLTLLSAPAGFGKSTVLAEWLAMPPPDDRRVAWLSLEESDGEPAVFWTYVLTALQTVVPGLGASVLPVLQAAQLTIETVLATVLNELSAVPDDVHLVLDDYHLVGGAELARGVMFLLDHPHRLLPCRRCRRRGDPR